MVVDTLTKKLLILEPNIVAAARPTNVMKAIRSAYSAIDTPSSLASKPLYNLCEIDWAKLCLGVRGIYRPFS